MYSHCRIRQRGGWCPDDNKERLALMDDRKRFNITDYNFIQRVEFSVIFKLVERLAQNWLKREKVCCPPVPIELVLRADEERPVEIRQLPLRSCHGALWRLSDGWIIQLRGDDSPAAQRYTLFHEAFHILAHRKATPVFSKRGTAKGTFNELLANYFAACMLMPTAWLEEKWAEVNDLDRITKIFQVPKSSACIRLKCLGFFNLSFAVWRISSLLYAKVNLVRLYQPCSLYYLP